MNLTEMRDAIASHEERLANLEQGGTTRNGKTKNTHKRCRAFTPAVKTALLLALEETAVVDGLNPAEGQRGLAMGQWWATARALDPESFTSSDHPSACHYESMRALCAEKLGFYISWDKQRSELS